MPLIDLTIRLGDIITMAGLLGGGVLVVLMQRIDIRLLAARVTSVEKSFDTTMVTVKERLDKLTSVIADLARHDERITAVENRINRLENKFE